MIHRLGNSIRSILIIISLLILTPEQFYMQDIKNKLTALVPEYIADWKSNGEDEFFNNENLFDYINGGAELYLSYGFNLVLKRTYSAPDQPDITIDIFDMQNSKNAFGVFAHSSEKFEDSFGYQSTQLQGTILFWKGQYFVSIMTFPETEESKAAMEELAKTVSAKIDENGTLPEVLNYLPEENMIDGSIHYFRHHHWQNTYYFISTKNILNINNTTECVLAKYSGEAKNQILMIAEYPSVIEAETAYGKYLDGFQSEISAGKKLFQTKNEDWAGSANFNNFILAVYNCETQTAAEYLLQKAMDNLK